MPSANSEIAAEHRRSKTRAAGPGLGSEIIQRAVAEHVGRERRNQAQKYTAQFLLIAVALALWEIVSGRLVDGMFISKPSAIAVAMYEGLTQSDMLTHSRYTATEAVMGFVLGSAVAIALAIVIVSIPRGYSVVQPIAVAIYGIPKVALAPLFIIWFGLGIASKVAISGFMVFFIVLLSTMDALTRTPPGIIKAARILGASRAQILWRVNIPSAVPSIFTSFKLAVPISMIGAVVGEFISAQKGLGFYINRATLGFNTASAFAGVFLLMLIVVLMNAILTTIDRRILPWRNEQHVIGF
jgi:NitT/TauT family transport system permease protein